MNPSCTQLIACSTIQWTLEYNSDWPANTVSIVCSLNLNISCNEICGEILQFQIHYK